MTKRLDGSQVIQKKISGVNWNQVYYFSLVATYGSIKRAAEILNLSPSTLSEHISQLESELKAELFFRRGPKLSLTEQGNRLFVHAKGMFEHSQRLLDAVSPLHLGSYPVSIGFIPGAHLPLAYNWVGKFNEEFGPLNMKLQHCQQETFESALIQGKFDFGFSNHPPTRSDLNSAKIAQSPVRFYVSSQWRDHSLADLLKDLPLLICRSETLSETFIEKYLRDIDLVPNNIVTSDFPGALVDLCLKGLGVGAFCEEPVMKMNAQSLKSLRSPKDAPVIESSLYVIWSEAAENTEAVAHLRTLIKTESFKTTSPSRKGKWSVAVQV